MQSTESGVKVTMISAQSRMMDLQEAVTATEMFGRSVEQYQLRYTRFIGDGDTNSYKRVFESKLEQAIVALL